MLSSTASVTLEIKNSSLKQPLLGQASVQEFEIVELPTPPVAAKSDSSLPTLKKPADSTSCNPKVSTRSGLACGGVTGMLGGAIGYIFYGTYGMAAGALAVPAGLCGRYIFSVCDEAPSRKRAVPPCQGFKR